MVDKVFNVLGINKSFGLRDFIKAINEKILKKSFLE